MQKFLEISSNANKPIDFQY